MEVLLYTLLTLFWTALHCVSSQEVRSELFYRTAEEVPEGSFVGNVFKDAHMNDKYDDDTINSLRFRFLSSPNLDFTIVENSGVIRTEGRIDRDEICANQDDCNVVLNVVALIPETMTFIEIIKVTLEVIDINDNWPYFPETDLRHELLETTVIGTSFVVPSAIDPDSREFGIQSYILEPETDMFKLEITTKMDGSTDVKVVLQDQLDREKQEAYQMKVIAMDGGYPPKSGAMDLTILIQDTNDNAPVFDNSTYEVEVFENVPFGTSITQVHAKDPDSGLYGEVMYSFSPRTQTSYGHLFWIKNNTGEIFVKSLIDYEKGTIYHLVVMAKDRGPDSLPADATVIVQVQDVNDNAPQITVNTFAATGTDSAEVSEDADKGTFVAHITVVDPDSGENGQFKCHLNDNQFALQELYDEYKIATTAELDREEMAEYNLAITCQDMGVESQVSIKHLRVVVGDINDNSPVFNKDFYEARLHENNHIETFIVQVNATDLDDGKNSELVYSIEDEEAMDAFHIKESTGEISARSIFDREQLQEIGFKVIVKDKGNPPRSSSTSVLVHIDDVNDERPHFSQASYSFAVLENEPPGTEIGIVHAADRDLPPFNQFQFSIVPVHPSSNSFSIDTDTGKIITTVSLDRETRPYYTLIVSARDKNNVPMSSTASVTVHVGDVNDNPPVFQFPVLGNNTVQVSNTAPRGFAITKLVTHDADIGKNANISYDIVEGNEENLFDIDHNLGVVLANGDYSSIDLRLFELTVSAKDQGNPQHKIETTLNIMVNKSIAYAGGAAQTSGSGLIGHNLSIVIGLGCASGIIMVILIIAILCLRRQDRTRRDQKYNCRMEALKIMNPSPGTKPGDLNHQGESGLANGSCAVADPHLKQQTEFYEEYERPNGYVGSYSPHKGPAWTAKVANSNHQVVPHYGSGSVIGVASGHRRNSDISSISHPGNQPNNGLPDMATSTYHHDNIHNMQLQSGQQVDPSRTWSHLRKEMEVHRLMNMLKSDQQDAVSTYSQEGSNTDSGRGPSEDGNPSRGIPDILNNTGSPEQLSSRFEGSDAGLPHHSRPNSTTNSLNDNNHPGFPPSYESVNCRRGSAGSAGPPVKPRRFQRPYAAKQQCQRPHMRPENSSNSSTGNHPPPLPVRYAPHSQHAPVHGINSCHGNNVPNTGYYGNSKTCDNSCCSEDSASSSEDESNMQYSQSDIDQAIKGPRGSGRYPRPRKVQVLDTISDNGSTTSGSYVVDPQDLCNEINELFFKDMVV